MFDEFVKRVSGGALGRIPTLELTARAVGDCCGSVITGDFVECGVWGGAHPALMALVSRSLGFRNTIHLFDSFIGIPKGGPDDDCTITDLVGRAFACVGCADTGAIEVDGVDRMCPCCRGQKRQTPIEPSGVSAVSEEDVRKNMAMWCVDTHGMMFHKGWFQNTVPAAVVAGKIPRGIAILRLDGDLYESTRVCLEHLHPLVVKGGYVIIDDYALTGCRKAVTEYLGQHDIRPNIIEVKGGGGPVYYRK